MASGALLSWLRTLTAVIPAPLLHGAGLILLADIPARATKTALWGTSIHRDALLLTPSLHKQKDLSSLSNGEYPACAAMTTGYVFRVENEAMVTYMQRVGRPGQLTTLSVSAYGPNTVSATIARLVHDTASSVTILVIGLLALMSDQVALGVISSLIAVNIANTILFERRAELGWKGEKEPGVRSDLLVLLSQDRWVRLRGWTDDVKVVTSGQWLRQQTVVEDLCSTLIIVVVHLSAGAMLTATPEGKLLFCFLMVFNSIAIEIANALTDQLKLYGRTISIVGERKRYGRRLDMAAELIREIGTDNWCEKMGIILSEDAKRGSHRSTGAAHM